MSTCREQTHYHTSLVHAAHPRHINLLCWYSTCHMQEQMMDRLYIYSTGMCNFGSACTCITIWYHIQPILAEHIKGFYSMIFPVYQSCIVLIIYIHIMYACISISIPNRMCMVCIWIQILCLPNAPHALKRYIANLLELHKSRKQLQSCQYCQKQQPLYKF